MNGKCTILSNGSEIWRLGKDLHRVDGPAIVNKTSNMASYYLFGKRYTFEHYVQKVISEELITDKQLCLFLLRIGNYEETYY